MIAALWAFDGWNSVNYVTEVTTQHSCCCCSPLTAGTEGSSEGYVALNLDWIIDCDWCDPWASSDMLRTSVVGTLYLVGTLYPRVISTLKTDCHALYLVGTLCSA